MDTLRLPAKKEYLDRFRTFVLEKIEPLDISTDILFKIELVLEEILSNVVSYAYLQGDGDLEVGCSLEDDARLFLCIKDWGRPFNPLCQRDPELSEDVCRRRVGGLGIYMVKKIVDEMRYERLGDQNILTLSIQISLR